MTNTEGPESTGDRLENGALISGKYRVEKMLAEGAMGQVYVAVQDPIGRKVAIKVLKRALVGDAELKERFLREAVAVSKLHHPNTITVLDYGEHEGTLFMAMELLEGEDLESLLTREGPLDPKRAARLASQIASALTEAHDKDILHRDLKPPNIFVSQVKGKGEFVKVLDFGIAKLLDNAEVPLTRAGMVFGTPEYMAPEQSTGGDLDGRTDLYALGVILWQMLCGELPYTGTHPLDTALKHTTEPIPALPDTVPEPMRVFVTRAMAKTKGGRPADAEAFVSELSEAAGIRNDAPPPSSTGAQSAIAPPRRSSLPIILALLAALGLFALAGVGIVGYHFYAQNQEAKADAIESKARAKESRKQEKEARPSQTVLEIDCKQGKAKVKRGGKTVGNTPVKVKGTPGDKDTFTIEKKGFKTKKTSLRYPKKGRNKVVIDLGKKKSKGGPVNRPVDKKDGWKPDGANEY